jgi:8-oxo-dGTP pyrophosphatase MutT (NUDIX family)
MGNGEGIVRAAGGVVWRMQDDVVEVLLVHRPRYDDWTFPKGKLDAGESHEQAAVREVQEESGFSCAPGHELSSIGYVDGKGRPKTVRYWEMRVLTGEFEPNDEVDVIRWVPIDEVGYLLTYDHDEEVLESFVRFAAQPPGARPTP